MATSLRDKFVKNNACTAQNPPQPANGSLTAKRAGWAGWAVCPEAPVGKLAGSPRD